MKKWLSSFRTRRLTEKVIKYHSILMNFREPLDWDRSFDYLKRHPWILNNELLEFCNFLELTNFANTSVDLDIKWHAKVLKQAIERGAKFAHDEAIQTQGRIKYRHVNDYEFSLISEALKGIEEWLQSNHEKELKMVMDEHPYMYDPHSLGYLCFTHASKLSKLFDGVETLDELEKMTLYLPYLVTAIGDIQINAAQQHAVLREDFDLWDLAQSAWSAATLASQYVLVTDRHYSRQIQRACRDSFFFHRAAFASAKAGDAIGAVLFLEQSVERIQYIDNKDIEDLSKINEPTEKTYQLFLEAQSRIDLVFGFHKHGDLNHDFLGFSALASSISRRTDQENEEYFRKVSEALSKIESDPKLREQFHLLGFLLTNDDPSSSPYYDEEAFKEVFDTLKNAVGHLIKNTTRSDPNHKYLANLKNKETIDELTFGSYAATRIALKLPPVVQLTIEELLKPIISWPTDHAVVHIILHPDQTCFLFTSHENSKIECSTVFLDTFSYKDALHILNGSPESNTVGWMDAYENRNILMSQWMSALESALSAIQKRLVLPLVDALRDKGFLSSTLILPDPLHQLPVLGSCIDSCPEITWSSAPSLRHFVSSLNSASDFSEPPMMFAVHNPTPSTLPPLADAADEIAIISTHFVARSSQDNWIIPRVLSGDRVNARMLKDLMGSVVHLACHAFSTQGVESGIMLSHDQKLSPRNLKSKQGNQNPNYRLAFLAACESGRAQRATASEGDGLISQFHSLGYSAVIATLWPVNSMASALFSIHFYHQWIGLKAEPKAAFQRSVLWLKTTTTSEKTTFLDKTMRDWIEKTIFPTDKKEEAYAAISRLMADLYCSSGKLEWNHPLYWGGIVFSGE